MPHPVTTISSLTIRYDPEEDRIAFYCWHSDTKNNRRLDLTRALVRKFLDYFHARLLPGTTSQEPRNEALVNTFIHQEAVRRADQQAQKGPDDLNRLNWSKCRISRLEMSAGAAGSVTLQFFSHIPPNSEQSEGKITFGAEQVHWLLNRLTSLSGEAQWGLSNPVQQLTSTWSTTASPESKIGKLH